MSESDDIADSDESIGKLLHGLRGLVTSTDVDNQAFRSDIERHGREKDEKLLLIKRAVESVRNGICITNQRLHDNPIIYVNDAFLSMTGYGRHQVLGRNCRFLQRDDRDQAAIQQIKDAIKD